MLSKGEIMTKFEVEYIKYINSIRVIIPETYEVYECELSDSRKLESLRYSLKKWLGITTSALQKQINIAIGENK